MPSFAQEYHRSSRLTPPQCLSRSQKKLLLFFLKCVIMVVIMSLFLFFLGFAVVVLLHFLFISSAFHRCCHTAAASESSPHKKSLIPHVLYSVACFPAFSDCAICLDSFREGDLCRNIPVCRHLFHANCVDSWIIKNPTCPVCRIHINLGSSGSEIDDEDQWKRLWHVHTEEVNSY